ncbi:MAG: nonstructural protein [Microvirus sp.]|nr:MAG: nonstructural protein [Microvirus sp.]
MKYSLFSVFDRVAATFGAPFMQQNTRLAVRSFGIAVNDPNSMMFKAPDDYSLHELATFDDDTGIVECLTKPTPVAYASQLIKDKS